MASYIDLEKTIISYPVADNATLKSFDITGVNSGVFKRVVSTNQAYFWDSASTVTPDNLNYICPNSITPPAPGRWIRAKNQNNYEASYTTSQTLPAGMPRLINLNPINGAQAFKLPNLTNANGFEVGEPLVIANISSGNQTTIHLNDDTPFSSAILPGEIFLCVISSVGTPGSVALYSILQNMSSQSSSAIGVTGGTMSGVTIDNCPIGQTTPAAAIFSQLQYKYSSFIASFLATITGNHDYTFPDKSINVGGITGTPTTGHLARFTDAYSVEDAGAPSQFQSYSSLLDELSAFSGYGPTFFDGTKFYLAAETTNSDTSLDNTTAWVASTLIPMGSTIDLTATTAKTFTLTSNISISSGYYFDVYNSGAGTVTFVGNTGNSVLGVLTMPGGNPSFVNGVSLYRVRYDYFGGQQRWMVYKINTTRINTQGNTQSAGAYGLVLSDADGVVNTTNASNCSVNIPTNASVPFIIGTTIDIYCKGGASALATLTTSGGVTLTNNTNAVIGNNARMRIRKTDTDTWNIDEIIEFYVHTTNWAGIWASPQSGNISVSRINRNITLTIPQIQAAATISAVIQISTVLPARFRSSQNTYQPIIVTNNSAIVMGGYQIATDGNIYFYAQSGSNPASSFTGSGTGGTSAQSLPTYTI